MGNTSFTCVLTSKGGATVIRSGTHQNQLRKRASSAKTPRSRLAGSTLQYASARSHFHPLSWLAQPSRFVTWEEGKDAPSAGLLPRPGGNLSPLPLRLARPYAGAGY